jgi:hypothetical protein
MKGMKTTLSAAAVLALKWFAFQTGAFADPTDRAPEPAIVHELRAAGLLFASGMPTAKGETLLAEMAKPLPKKGATREAFEVAYKASYATAKDAKYGHHTFAWTPVALDGLGRTIEVRAANFGVRNVLGFELRGNLSVSRAMKGSPRMTTRHYGPKSEMGTWAEFVVAQRDGEVRARAWAKRGATPQA